MKPRVRVALKDGFYNFKSQLVGGNNAHYTTDRELDPETKDKIEKITGHKPVPV